MFFSPYALYVIPIVVVVTLVLIAASVRILREYERAVVFTLGRFQKVKGPGRAARRDARQYRRSAIAGPPPRPLTADLGEVGMQRWQRLRRAGRDNLLPQLVLPTLECAQLLHQRAAAAGVGNGLDHGPDLSIHPREIRLQLRPSGRGVLVRQVHLGDIPGDEGFDESRRKEAILQSHKHPRQYLVAKHGAAIGAGVSLAMIGASKTPMFSNDCHAAATETAAHEP
jgi:hypothetical protein